VTTRPLSHVEWQVFDFAGGDIQNGNDSGETNRLGSSAPFAHDVGIWREPGAFTRHWLLLIVIA